MTPAMPGHVSHV